MEDGYDALAAGYDAHFTRPVDHWEDDRLAAMLRPVVDDRNVLDLGCGTGWLLDHCSPARYTGVDNAPGMLEELVRKHHVVTVVKADIGAPGWQRAIPGTGAAFDTITATWALQYLYGDGVSSLRDLLTTCSWLVKRGGVVALHGYLPRYRSRHHYIGWPRHVPPVVRPADVAAATAGTGLSGPQLMGCGALPDWLAFNEGAWWAALNAVPAGWHYSGLWMWSRQ
jgi:SAM-dependent methyltransferase